MAQLLKPVHAPSLHDSAMIDCHLKLIKRRVHLATLSTSSSIVIWDSKGGCKGDNNFFSLISVDSHNIVTGLFYS